MTRSKFDKFLDSFDLTGTKPTSDNVDLPVADEQNSRFDFSRSRGLPYVHPRHDDVNTVPVLDPLPEEELDPHVEEPEEDVHIEDLQRNVDNSPSVRPKEFGRNLSLPPVSYTKSKVKRQNKEVKKPANKKN